MLSQLVITGARKPHSDTCRTLDEEGHHLAGVWFGQHYSLYRAHFFVGSALSLALK